MVVVVRLILGGSSPFVLALNDPGAGPTAVFCDPFFELMGTGTSTAVMLALLLILGGASLASFCDSVAASVAARNPSPTSEATPLLSPTVLLLFTWR